MPEKLPPAGQKPGVQPLKKDAAANNGLRPISVSGNSGPPPSNINAAADLVVADNATEQWLAEHPEGDPAFPPDALDRDALAADATPVAAAEDPTDDAPATDAPPAADPATPPAAKPAVVAEAKPGEAEPPAADKPAEKPKPTYAADERFALGANADGTPVEWTREQIVSALRERESVKPLAEESGKWRELFGVDYAKAEGDWKPLLGKLRANPQLTLAMDAALDDPALSDYLLRSVAHFNDERAAGNVPAAQPRDGQPQPQTEEQKRIAALEQRIAARDRQDQLDAATREITDAVRQYPILGQDRALFEELIQTADLLHARDPKMGMKDALASKRALYEAITLARAKNAAPAEPPADVPPVPALLGSAGAAPGGSRPVDNGRPKKYDDLGDAVEDHLRKYPQ
jgi:hypothetical protein